ncbi:zinc-binding dehydrogenase [Streptomyces sp. NPDC002920]
MLTTAAVLRNADAPFALEQVELPDPGPGEARVRIVAAGLCHTDLLPRTRGPFGRPPVILGHEGAGIVDALGEGVTGLAVGDHVVASFHACGTCPACAAGRAPYCRRFWELNFSGAPRGAALAADTDGAPVSSRWFGQSSFAQHAIVPTGSLIPVPPDLPLEQLAPLGCSVLTGAASILRALRVTAGEAVVVLGVGAVGLVAVMAARAAGAAHIVAVDRNEQRLALARHYGATGTVTAHDDLATALRDSHPAGFDAALDTTGAPTVIAAAVGALTPTGTCGLLGSPLGDLVLPRTALSGGRTVRGILFGDASPRQTVPELITLWQRGDLPFTDLIRTYPLSAINDAEADFTAGRTVKPVLLPQST